MGQALRERLACLPERQRIAVVRVDGFEGKEPVTMADIGREWGITRERVCQIRNAVLVLLRLPHEASGFEYCEEKIAILLNDP